MASVTLKQKSSQSGGTKFWQARFKDERGKYVMKSTKLLDRKKAQKWADDAEEAARKAREGELTQEAARQVLDAILERSTGTKLKSASVRDHLQKWMGQRRPTTAKRYKPIIDGFLAQLGEKRASAAVRTVTSLEVERFRDAELAAGKGATTANFAVKTLRAAFSAARSSELMTSNPAEAVNLIESSAEEREVFTNEELASLYHSAGDSEWRGMILFGAHGGLRLNDAANLTWGAIDLEAGVLVYRPAKTANRKKNKDVHLALHPEILNYLAKQPQGVGKAPLFPTLHGKPSGSAGGLSNAFAALMEKAEVVVRLGEAKTGKGRRFRSKGFHSLRHTLVSRLANVGVGADVRKALVGHSDDATHQKYTHLSMETQRQAVGQLPALG
jgi:integrase